MADFEIIYIPTIATEREAILILVSRIAELSKHDTAVTAALLNLIVVVEELAHRQSGMMGYDLGVLVGQAKIALGINS